jgi:hypothetical protein
VHLIGQGCAQNCDDMRIFSIKPERRNCETT